METRPASQSRAACRRGDGVPREGDGAGPGDVSPPLPTRGAQTRPRLLPTEPSTPPPGLHAFPGPRWVGTPSCCLLQGCDVVGPGGRLSLHLSLLGGPWGSGGGSRAQNSSSQFLTTPFCSLSDGDVFELSSHPFACMFSPSWCSKKAWFNIKKEKKRKVATLWGDSAGALLTSPPIRGLP